MIWRFWLSSKLAHISLSVKSGAGASRTRPQIRSGRARAASSAIQPPIDEPTTTSGPSVS
jgi:hypothetical protein